MDGAVRELFAMFGFKFDDKGLDEADKKIQKFSGKLQTFAKGIAGAAIVKWSYDFAQGIAAIGDHLEDSSNRLGVNTDALQELQFAADQSGASVESLSAALLMLQDRQGDALKGGESGKVFKSLGLAIRDANGDAAETEGLFSSAAEAISKLPSPAQQATAAIDLFGRQGKELLPTLKLGAKGIDELRAKFRSLGGGFSKKAIKASDEFKDAQGRLGVAFDTIKGKIAEKLFPALSPLIDRFSDLAKRFGEIVGKSSAVEVALGAVGAIAGVLAAKMALAFAPVIAAGVILEDLYTWMSGGESAFGDLLDFFGGEGTSTKWLYEVRDVFKDISTYVKDLTGDLRILGNWLDEKAESIGKLFAAKAGNHPLFRGNGKPMARYVDHAGGGTSIVEPDGRVSSVNGVPNFARLTGVPNAISATTNNSSSVARVEDWRVMEQHNTINVNGGDPAQIKRVFNEMTRSQISGALNTEVRRARRK